MINAQDSEQKTDKNIDIIYAGTQLFDSLCAKYNGVTCAFGIGDGVDIYGYKSVFINNRNTSSFIHGQYKHFHDTIFSN